MRSLCTAQLRRVRRMDRRAVHPSAGPSPRSEAQSLAVGSWRFWRRLRYLPTVRRVGEFVGLAGDARDPSGAPLWMLGRRYGGEGAVGGEGAAGETEEATEAGAAAASVAGAPEALTAAELASFRRDFASRVWCTYREGFRWLPRPGSPPPRQHAGDAGDSDMGWGCTLRSGQMLLANALLLAFLGRDWRWRRRRGAGAGGEGARGGTGGSGDEGEAGDAGEVGDAGASARERAQAELAHLALLRWFGDAPVSACPFSLHALLAAGEPHGARADEWLGPTTVCRALERVVNQERPSGMVCYLAGADHPPESVGAAGGSPELYLDEVMGLCEQWGGVDVGLQLQYAPHTTGGARGTPSEDAAWSPLLLLVPLKLGVGRTINPVYVPQLHAALAMPQSLGMVGGKHNASLYFVGVQGESGSAHAEGFYLDPHTVQPAAEAGPYSCYYATGDEALDAAKLAQFPADSYHCDRPRHMPLAAVDPSLALAFRADSREDLEELAEALDKLARQSPLAPLLTVARARPQAPAVCPSSPAISERGGSVTVDQGEGDADGWELLD